MSKILAGSRSSVTGVVSHQEALREELHVEETKEQELCHTRKL